MTVGKLCTRDLATASRETPVAEAARQMRHRHVGDLVVVEAGRPVGIVTDRDIVISVVATGLDASVFTLGDLVLKDPVTCNEDLDASECLHQMRIHGVRRMLVVNKSGKLVGILTVDDLLRVLAAELGEMAKLIDREQVMEMKTRV
jgi:CBS domain-containing protein